MEGLQAPSAKGTHHAFASIQVNGGVFRSKSRVLGVSETWNSAKMSFGYSVSDFIVGVNLTYQLIHALSETQGACLEYQEAMQELGAIQQTFLQVSQLKASNLVNHSILNGASHIILSSMKVIEDFLNRTR